MATPYPSDKILEARDLRMFFPITRGLLRKEIAQVKAVDGVTFDVKRGETFGLVGESGCGKTTVGRCILRVYRLTGGQVFFKHQDISQIPETEFRTLRRKMQLICQDPYRSLDPRQGAGSIVGEPLKIHKMFKSRSKYWDRIEELFSIVGLNPSMTDRFPHEFSGGQRQRIGIARALACEPELVVCDEPVSSLDVSVQAQIINLLKKLQQSLKLTYVFISHDLAVVRHISDRVGIMYLGRIVEIGDRKTLYENPLHPYTQALLSTVPVPDPAVEENRRPVILRGEVPSPVDPPPGCNFHTRCPAAVQECKGVVPELRDVGYGHKVACIQIP
jgi:oligopeptide/dipeptide ABC transporter ATP-binding protein